MKKQLRKGLSLFLAVMMLMSAWVWVAPEKAEAASGTYHVKLVVSSNNDTGGWDAGRCTLNGKANKGKASSESQIWYGSNNRINFKGDRTWYEGDTDKFPTSVSYYYQFGGGITHRKMDAYIRVYVNDIEVMSCQCYSYEWGQNKGTKSASTPSSKYPQVSTITPDNPIELTAPKFGNPKPSTGSATFYATDNYGVAWEPEFSFSSVCVSKTSDASSTMDT